MLVSAFSKRVEDAPSTLAPKKMPKRQQRTPANPDKRPGEVKTGVKLDQELLPLRW